LFYGSSVGCVAGVELSDRRRVVIKAYQPRWSGLFLTAAARVQRHLARATYPCPDVIVAGETIGPARANVESYLSDPGCRPLTSSEEMAVSAAGLDEQIDRCRFLREPDLAHHPLNRGRAGLYPLPHSPIFDFSIDTEPARWIDDLAERAVAVRDRHPPEVVIAHTDWSARNIRVLDGRLEAVYDWDSLALVSEPIALGQAAATWRSTGEPDDPIAPGPEEVSEYISCYERSGGRPLTKAARRAALAAALWVLCYTGRCEHALEAATGQSSDRARARLAADGPRFLT
jgi:Phosphotransferase enzyme family